MLQLGDLALNNLETKQERDRNITLFSGRQTPSSSNKPMTESETVEIPLSKLYDRFRVKLSSLKLQYYNSIDNFFSNQRTLVIGILKNTDKNFMFDVLEDFSVTLEVDILKAKGHVLKDKPRVSVAATIHQIKMNLSSKTLIDLKEMGKLFSNPDYGVQELLQTDKKNLIDAAYKLGGLQKRSKQLKKGWNECYVVFSGNCLYFFNHPKDILYESYVYVKDASVKEASKEAGKSYTIKVSY